MNVLEAVRRALDRSSHHEPTAEQQRVRAKLDEIAARLDALADQEAVMTRQRTRRTRGQSG